MVVGGTIVLLILLCFIISFLFLYKNRQNRHQLEMEKVKEQYNQEILKTQLEIKEQTLRNISEELHDNFGQVLSLVILNLSAIDFSEPDQAEAKVEAVTQLVIKVIADLRNLSKTLDPENISKFGLPSVIRFESDMLEKTGLYKVAFTVDGSERKLELSKEIIVYRIVQETLNNIIKHARTNSVTIALRYRDDRLDIEIADNGRGFDLSRVDDPDFHNRGSGLYNMRKRSELINASLDIQSIPEKGTCVSMSIPFHPDPLQNK